MEHARTADHAKHEEKAHAWIHHAADGLEETRLACRTGKGQHSSEQVELRGLGGEGQHRDEATDSGMKTDVKPAADGVLWRILPRLHAEAMAEEVGGFPVVVRLVTIKNGREVGRKKTGNEEAVEGEPQVFIDRRCRGCFGGSRGYLRTAWSKD